MRRPPRAEDRSLDGAKVEEATTVTNHAHACLPLGAADAAERYGVRPDTIGQRRWRDKYAQTRDPMPDPDWTVSGRPVWCAATLDPWARRALRWDGATR
jgi:hypothetical protein